MLPQRSQNCDAKLQLNNFHSLFVFSWRFYSNDKMWINYYHFFLTSLPRGKYILHIEILHFLLWKPVHTKKINSLPHQSNFIERKFSIFVVGKKFEKFFLVQKLQLGFEKLEHQEGQNFYNSLKLSKRCMK